MPPAESIPAHPVRLASWWPSMLMLVLALTCCALCVKFPGTTDVPDYWLRWSGLMGEHGLSGGYTIAYSDYPPGAFAFLFLTSRTAAWLHLSNFLLLKINITLCALLGTLAFGLWSRNLRQTAGFLFVLTLNSAAHGYLDAVGLPVFLLSLWALERNRLALASCCFTLAAAIKWQPLIIAPFFLVHALDLRPANLLQPRVWLGALGRLAAGALPVIAAAMLCFKPVTGRQSGRHTLILPSLLTKKSELRSGEPCQGQNQPPIFCHSINNGAS